MPQGRIQPGGQLNLQGFPMKLLIQIAFNINDDQLIANAPKWFDSTKYSVIARTSAVAAGAQPNAPQIDIDDVRLMLRALIAERFKLATHYEDRPVDAYLAEVVRQVRSGALDQELVYRKNLRKDTDDYTASTPPHVAAARKSTQPPGRLISYVVTTDGPEPLDNRRHPLDREHYVAKQVRPVAEPVLETLGLDFEGVIGDSRQASLF